MGLTKAQTSLRISTDTGPTLFIPMIVHSCPTEQIFSKASSKFKRPIISLKSACF